MPSRTVTPVCWIEHLSDRDRDHPDEVLDEVGLRVVDCPFLFADLGSDDNVVTAELRVGHATEQLRLVQQPDQRVGKNFHGSNRKRDDVREPVRMHRPPGLGQDLRDHEDQHGHQGTGDGHSLVSPDLAGLAADTGGTGCVSDGVERQDGCQWLVDILLHCLEDLPTYSVFFDEPG
jgi:hypothetical protein